LSAPSAVMPRTAPWRVWTNGSPAFGRVWAAAGIAIVSAMTSAAQITQRTVPRMSPSPVLAWTPPLAQKPSDRSGFVKRRRQVP
jgi:hypothetical protein